MILNCFVIQEDFVTKTSIYTLYTTGEDIVSCKPGEMPYDDIFV